MSIVRGVGQGETRQHMWLVGDVVDVDCAKYPETSEMDITGVTAEGKLLPPVLRLLEDGLQRDILEGVKAKVDLIVAQTASQTSQAAS